MMTNVKPETMLIEARLRRVFAYRLRRARIRARMSLAGIEARTGFSQAFLLQVEDGTAELNLDMMEALASVLKSKVSDLLLSPMAEIRDPLPDDRKD